MDFRIILRDNSPNITDDSSIVQPEDTTDYTVTFVIGSCVLAAFLLLGIVASAYLCLTLKKGTLLWVSDSNRQLNKDKGEELRHSDKEVGSGSLKELKSTSSSQETTQI